MGALLKNMYRLVKVRKSSAQRAVAFVILSFPVMMRMRMMKMRMRRMTAKGRMMNMRAGMKVMKSYSPWRFACEASHDLQISVQPHCLQCLLLQGKSGIPYHFATAHCSESVLSTMMIAMMRFSTGTPQWIPTELLFPMDLWTCKAVAFCQPQTRRLLQNHRHHYQTIHTQRPAMGAVLFVPFEMDCILQQRLKHLLPVLLLKMSLLTEF